MADAQVIPPLKRVFGQWEGLGAWRRHLGLLGLGLLLLFLLSAPDVADIVAIWLRTGAFHHCLLLPFIIGWLVWQRRGAVAGLTPEFARGGCVIVALGASLWLLGAAAYVGLLRQAGFVICAQGLCVALLGITVARALIFPLGYMLFLIPAGSELEPFLQTITAKMAVTLLHFSGTAATLEGVFIATPAGLFRIAEACSGTAFLLAMAAYAALVCALCFKSIVRRAIFVAVAMAAAIFANGLRAYAVMELANLTSIANPIVSDHLIYGWLLFAAIVALLMWGASRWFDRSPNEEIAVPRNLPHGAGHQRAVPILAVAAALLLLPRLWIALTNGDALATSSPPVPPSVAGWTQIPVRVATAWHPHYDGATWIGQWHYTDAAGEGVDFAIIIFDQQHEGRELIGFGQGAVPANGPWAGAGAAPSPKIGRGEWLRGPDNATRYAATFYLVDSTVTGANAIAKLAAVRARLLGGRHEAMALIVSAEAKRADDAARMVLHFLSAAGPVQLLADRAHPIR